MPRPKSYDRAEALQRAEYAFWEHGYRTLGVRELEKLTGINRFALQTDFGGKQGLFLEALELYFSDGRRYIHGPVRDGDLDAIRDLLRGLVKPHPDTRRHFGCLMVNTSVENASLQDREIQARVDRHFDELTKAIKTNLRRAKRNGQLREGLSLEMAADFVVGSTIAINTMNRNARDVRAGRHYVKAALDYMATWSAGS